MDEFELIARCFRDRTPRRPDTVLGIGDDAALLDPCGQPLVHTWATTAFPAGDDAAGVARYVFAAALLRLAARAVTPRWTTLGLTLEDVEPGWIERFSTAAASVCEANGVELIGGDTTRGPGRATVFALGAGPALPQRPEPRPRTVASGNPDRILRPGGSLRDPEPRLPASTAFQSGRSPHEIETGIATATAGRSTVEAPKGRAFHRTEARLPTATSLHHRRSPHETETGTTAATASEAAPAFALRFSPGMTEAPERTIAALVSACTDLAGRGAGIRWSDAPGTDGDTRVPELVAHTDAAGGEVLRAAADPHRPAVASPDAADA